MSEDKQGDAPRSRFPAKYSRKEGGAEEVNAQSLSVQFSPGVSRALHNLEAAVHFSEHFDPDIYLTLRDWVQGKPVTLDHVLISLPLMIMEGSRHCRATGDERAGDALEEICTQMCDNGFTLTQRRKSNRAKL